MAVTTAHERNGRVAWIVPTYKQSRPLWRQAERAVAPLREYGVIVNRSERTIEFPWGGGIGIYSMDNPDSIRGEAFHLVILDEAAMIPEEAWTDAIQPTLADYGGRALLISTPKGRNWFHREFMRGFESGIRSSYRAPSSANPNPRIQQAALEAKDRVPERTYRQEWLAEFIEHQGAVFRNIKACLTALRNADPRDHLGHDVVIGVDWAQSVDFTAISVFCGTCRSELELDRFNQVEWALQRGRLAALASKWHASEILVERNSIGSPNLEALRDEGLPAVGFTTTAASKAKLIQSLALAFEREEARWLDIPFATAELESFEASISGTTGRASYAAPQGMHDDTVIARALAFRQAQVESWEVLQ